MRSPVTGLQRIAFTVRQHLFPRPFRITEQHTVRMLQRFIRHKGDMVTAHHHGFPLTAEPVSKLVTALCRERFRRNGN